MVSNTMSLPPYGFQTAVAVRAKQGEAVGPTRTSDCSGNAPGTNSLPELLAPGGDRMRLVHHNQPDAAAAYEMTDVVREQ